MGYHVTILRSKNGTQQPISASETQEAVAGFPELQMRSAADGRFEIVPADHSDLDFWLEWHEGEIWTKNPDEKTIAWMLKLADKLHARVRGDEYETYKTPSETYKHPDDIPLMHAADQEGIKMIQKGKRQYRIILAVLCGTFLSLLWLFGLLPKKDWLFQSVKFVVLFYIVMFIGSWVKK